MRKPTSLQHTFLVIYIYGYYFVFTFITNVLILFTLCLSDITAKVSYRHLICNCYFANSISYVTCRFVYNRNRVSVLTALRPPVYIKIGSHCFLPSISDSLVIPSHLKQCTYLPVSNGAVFYILENAYNRYGWLWTDTSGGLL